jgi:hypothetical protein
MKLRLRDLPWPWILLGVGLLFYGHQREGDGAIKEKVREAELRVRAREKVIAALVTGLHQVDTMYIKGKTVYLADVAAYQSAPSLPLADKAIASCSRLVLTCDQRKAKSDSIILNQNAVIAEKDSLLELERKRHPGRWGCLAGGGGSNKGLVAGVFCGRRVL